MKKQKQYRDYPEIIYNLRAILLFVLIKIPFLEILILSILHLFSSNDRIYAFSRYIERSTGFSKVLKKGDIAIQAGVCMDTKNSQVFDMARAVGKGGTILAIEPDPDNVKRLKKIVKKNNFACRFIIIQKATYSRKKKTKMILGQKTSWNRIESKPNVDLLKKDGVIISGDEIEVETDTIENIIKENNVDPKKIKYINLTINGAEYETLKGAENILKTCEDLAVTAAAGREFMAKGKNDIAFINGKLDWKVISEYLDKLGFKTRFKRFGKKKFGYVIAAKGKQRFFM